jgi:phosphatidylserine/phosphatidylglycerophosphate/cardiolipin synthase-like enzyme
MLFSKSVRRMFVCVVLLLPAITEISAAGQSSSTLCAPSAHAVVLYAPESNLERSEIETLRTAKVSVDVAMHSFTDRELAAELVRLARSGVRVRVYRDSRESMQENQRGSSTTPTLLAGGVEVHVKASQDLMHFKSMSSTALYCVPGRPTGRRLASSARTMMCITK